MYMSLSSGAQLDQIRMLVNRFSMKVCFAVAFCALTVVRVSAQQPSKPSGGSIIQGRVIYSDTGQPLRRAEISLVTQDGADWVGHSISNRNGEFVFNNIGAGRYFVVVEALDIVSVAPQIDSLSLKVALGQIDDGYSEVSVTLQPNETRTVEVQAATKPREP